MINKLISSWGLSGIRRWISNCLILGYKYGHLKSICESKPVDMKGNPIPWYTYPALEYLNQFDFSHKSLFEFGSGNSSLYWAPRVKMVVSVESDSQWYGQIKERLQENQNILLRQDEKGYVNSLKEQGVKFDIIVIDGQWRRQCANNAINFLERDGVIILDNSDWYPNTAADIRGKGFFQINFSGFGPINSYTWTTSIFIREYSNLQENFTNIFPIGGINQYGSDDQ